MGAIWFWIVVAMLIAYVVLDGFDIGVGIVFPFVARTEEEREHAFRAMDRYGMAMRCGCSPPAGPFFSPFLFSMLLPSVAFICP